MKIQYTEHARIRMRQRDITEEEVIELLQLPRSVHRRSTQSIKYEVEAIIGERKYTVVYTRKDDVFKIITVY